MPSYPMNEAEQLLLDLASASITTKREEPLLLLSIQKPYFDQIRSGGKKFVDVPCKAFLFITAPCSRIGGVVEFRAPIVGSANDIAAIAEGQRSGHGDAVRDYLAGHEKG